MWPNHRGHFGGHHTQPPVGGKAKLHGACGLAVGGETHPQLDLWVWSSGRKPGLVWVGIWGSLEDRGWLQLYIRMKWRVCGTEEERVPGARKQTPKPRGTSLPGELSVSGKKEQAWPRRRRSGESDAAGPREGEHLEEEAVSGVRGSEE